MATPPTFVAEYETSYSSTGSAKTVSVTCADGDVLVCAGFTDDGGFFTLGTPTGHSGFSWSLGALPRSVLVTNYCGLYIWTAVVGAGQGQTFTCSITPSGSNFWGYNVLRFSGSDGVGASAKTNVASGAPSLALTTTSDNPAIVAFNGDWVPVDGASRTWRQINSITPTAGNGMERTYNFNSSFTTYYGAYWSDCGAAGAKTTGLSAPSGQKYSVIAVEIKGATSGVTVPAPQPLILPSQAVQQAANWKRRGRLLVPAWAA